MFLYAMWTTSRVGTAWFWLWWIALGCIAGNIHSFNLPTIYLNCKAIYSPCILGLTEFCTVKKVDLHCTPCRHTFASTNTRLEAFNAKWQLSFVLRTFLNEFYTLRTFVLFGLPQRRLLYLDLVFVLSGCDAVEAVWSCKIDSSK